MKVEMKSSVSNTEFEIPVTDLRKTAHWVAGYMGLGLGRVVGAEDRDLVIINIELTLDTVGMDELPTLLLIEKRTSEGSEEYQRSEFSFGKSLKGRLRRSSQLREEEKSGDFVQLNKQTNKRSQTTLNNNYYRCGPN